MAGITTLSASAGTSTPIALNPVAKATTVLLSLSVVGSTGAVTVEASLDDPSIPGGPSATWASISSGIAMLSSNISDGLIYTILSPISMVRINSTANNTSNTFTLKALQAIQS